MGRILALGLAAACLIAGGARSQKAYVDHANRYGFTPPSGWQRQDSSRAAVVYLAPAAATSGTDRPRGFESTKALLARLKRERSRPVVPEFRSNLAVHVRAYKGTLLEWAKGAEADAARTKLYRVLATGSTRLGDVEAVFRSIRLDHPGENATYLREVSCVFEGKLLSIVMASSAEAKARDAGLFDRVLLSFTWRR
jgi:hypothetical protein